MAPPPQLQAAQELLYKLLVRARFLAFLFFFLLPAAEMFLLRLLNHSGSTLKSCWLQLLQDSASGSSSVLLLSQLKKNTGNICSFFFFCRCN